MYTIVKIIFLFILFLILLMLIANSAEAQQYGATVRNQSVMVYMVKDSITGEYIAVITNSGDCISQIEIKYDDGRTVVTPVMPDGSFNYNFGTDFNIEVRNITSCAFSTTNPVFVSSTMKAKNILTGELLSNPKRKFPDCEKTIRPIKFPAGNDRDTTVATKM